MNKLERFPASFRTCIAGSVADIECYGQRKTNDCVLEKAAVTVWKEENYDTLHSD